MIAGFRKPKRNFRKKITTEDEDDNIAVQSKANVVPFLEDLNETEQDSLEPVKNVIKKGSDRKDKQKSTKSSSKGTGLLSFEHELDEGEEFQLKKTKESRKLMQRLKEEKKKKKIVETDNIPEYNDNQPLSDETRNYNLNETRNELNNVIVEPPEENDSDNDEDDDGDKKETDYSNIHSDLSTGVIPDAATIFKLKKQRERARQLGPSAEFVPLQTTVKYQGRFNSSKSRLVREDEDESDEERMEFKGSSKASFPALERRKEVAKALEDAHDEAETEKDEDEELHLWEQQQIKKGASIPASQNEQQYGPPVPPAYNQHVSDGNFQTSVNYSGGYLYGQAAPVVFGFPVQTMPSMMPQGTNVVTVEMVSQKLHERLASIEQVHRSHVLEMEKNRTDLMSYKDSIDSLEKKTGDVSDRFRFYQEMSGYIRDLLDCLNEKMPKIEDLESSMLQLWKQKSHKLSHRRIEDTKDEHDQINGKMTSKAANSGGTDEFGRDRGTYEETARQRRIAEREGRRNRRRKKRADNTEHHEGLSSDNEELDAEVNKYNTDRDRILKQRPTIFDDVVSDFSSLKEIKSRFEEWKFGFNDAYKEAYIHLCLPKLFSPIVRLEMLDWNPLQIDNKDFEDMEWYTCLAMYAYHEGENSIDEEAANIIPLAIEKVLIPRLTDLVKMVWDPLSKTQTDLLVLLIQRLADDYPTLKKQSKTTEMLMSEIITKMKSSIDTHMYIPLYSSGLLQNRSSGASAFLERQFWSGFKLFRNILSWTNLLSVKVLQELALDSILNRYLIVALQQLLSISDNLDKCKEIINTLPKVLLDGSDNLPQCLQPFARYLNVLAGNIYKSSLGYTDQEKKKAKIMIKKCISLLMHIQAFDIARNVARDYKIETRKDTS